MKQLFSRPAPGARVRLRATVAAVCAAVLLAPVAAQANPAEEKAAVDERVEELQAEHEGLSEELARVVAELEDAEAQLPDAEDAAAAAAEELEEAQRKDDELAARLTSAENAQDDIREEIDASEDRIEESERAVVEVGRRAYQNSGVTSDVAMLLEMTQSENGLDGLSRVDSAVRGQQRTLTQLNEQRSAGLNNQDRLDAAAQEVSDLRDEAAEVLLEKKAAESAAREAKEDLDALIAQKDGAAQTIEDNQASAADELRRQQEEQDRLADEVRRWEEEAERDGIPLPGDGELRNPAPGYPITSPFGWRTHPISGTRKLHTGTDFGIPCGNEVYSAGDGVVVSAGSAGGYGNRVVISHGKIRGQSISTTYNHNTRNVVRAGQTVSQGDVVALAGTTGSSTGCHLHFEVMQNGTYVDPMDWIS
ncbi:peptidoglycan DD-metalloendopeptidase family protein [Brevibacterium album]|uniref:peptidoglycan DD-metalloendopeptidase family protein n=1 Tax=Brevibacterium album TaxID=417948 RepID=UPI00041FBF59|nr:M23 family metallopeptidase [Brevibacterium album]